MANVTYEVKNHVGIIQYDNPPLNILTMAGLLEIKEAFLKADADQDTYVIFFTMAQHKKVFCGGMDLDEMLSYGDTREYCEVSKDI